jgi:guanine deaminase
MQTITTDQDRVFIEECIRLAVDNVASGGGPFSAMVVKNGNVLARACNQVTIRPDPTAHAEVEALRAAALITGDPHLTGCVLYASCEPCPMCLASAMWAHVSRIVFTAPHSEAVRAGFADTDIAEQLYGQARPVALKQDYLSQCVHNDAGTPFDAWLAKEDRREY